eukprot:gnl/TRDRNA2_/TRDRNA2_168941_c0_seq3.p1 gnl/TRDRNA2_/TRDRNA2_168941_c0~~gnl/TRDRNA2_/TRDRNA2_168941_c0_seq3.p1  ORF type:complete len:398 (+),score=49.08 gnl/TRDRNA2_/TRDRNA2_168941_c0_seq3:171-1196(+)
MAGFHGAYLESMLRPWIHHIRWVEPEMHIIIAVPLHHVTPELVRLVNFSRAAYRDVYLRWPPSINRSTDFRPETLEHIDNFQGARDKFGWEELQVAAVWNLDGYDGLLLLEPDAWPVRPLRHLLWCTERLDFLSGVGCWEPLLGNALVLKPSRGIFETMRTCLRNATIDPDGVWNGIGVYEPSMPGYRAARIDNCKYGGYAGLRKETGRLKELGIHPQYTQNCAAEDGEAERNLVLVHSKDHFNYFSPYIRELLARRQFDSRSCWSIAEHSFKEHVRVHSDSFKQNPEVEQRAHAFWAKFPYSFAGCCDLTKGPRGAELCWGMSGQDVALTFDKCCLLRPG